MAVIKFQPSPSEFTPEQAGKTSTLVHDAEGVHLRHILLYDRVAGTPAILADMKTDLVDIVVELTPLAVMKG